jgi:hypothetical protein
MITPRAAEREAFCVSSLMCADASYPVYVYCACSSPSKSTNHSQLCEKPLLLIVCPKTVENDWW